GLRVEDRGARADHGAGDEKQRIRARRGEHGESGQGEAHSHGERVGAWLAVRVAADQRLQQRGGDLVGEGEDPICPKVSAYDVFSIGYSAGSSDCIMSFNRWQKLIAASTEKAVRPAAPARLTLAAASFTGFPGGPWVDTVPDCRGESHLSFGAARAPAHRCARRG